jgi:uncharacterized protein YecA (UPF0149 family)
MLKKKKKKKKKANEVTLTHGTVNVESEMEELTQMIDMLVDEMKCRITYFKQEIHLHDMAHDEEPNDYKLDKRKRFVQMVHHLNDTYRNSWEGETFVGIFELMVELKDALIEKYGENFGNI